MEEILQTLLILLAERPDDAYFEIRALPQKRGPASIGWFNDVGQAARAVAELDASERYKGIYLCLNGREDDVPSPGKFVPKRMTRSLADADIDRYHWFLLDFDAEREDVNSPASEEELKRALNAAYDTIKFLRERGWPKPLIAMSGNGYHATWPLAEEDGEPGIPHTDVVADTYKKALYVLKDRFSAVDTTVYTPARIWRIAGTTSRKGTATEERPHRRAKLLNDEYNYISFDHIRELADLELTEEDGEEADVKLTKLIDWMDKEFPDAIGPKRYHGGGNKWQFRVCPWDDAHRDGSAFLIRFPSGAIVAGCHHNNCPGQERDDEGKLAGWRSLQAMASSKPFAGPATRGPSTQEMPGLTDLGNAKRLVNLYGQDMRYVPELGKWLFWTGTHWEEDTTGRIHRCAAGAVSTIFAQADMEPDLDQAKKIRAWAYRSESLGHLRAMVNLASTEEGVFQPVADFDADPWLLGVANGVLDLKTGQLSGHTREHYLTSVSEVEYDPNAECPLWDAALARAMDDDQEMIDFLYRALGYSMTGVTDEQVMFFAHGSGANGKSTLLMLVNEILGHFGRLIDSNILMTSKQDQHTTGLTDLKGLRLALASETRKDKRLAEDVIKRITGEETITARRMRQDNMTFETTHKLWLMTNHRPIIMGNDIGIWRRLVYVPFTVTIPEEERDSRLPQKLRAEAPGILNRLLEGCLAWQRHGLQVPEQARAQAADYKHEMDPLSEFFEDYCVLEDGAKISKQDLYEAFCDWNATRRGHLTTYTHFHRLLKERDFKDGVTTIGGKSIRVWHGITLADHVVVSVDFHDDGEHGHG